MSYAVELTREAVLKIMEWNLSSHLHGEILKGMDQLAADPNRRLIRVGPPYDVLQYDLVVREPADPPRDYLFAFTVLYSTDEERLLVVKCEHTIVMRDE